MTGRLPSITEDRDAQALRVAVAADGQLPAWVEADVRDALTRAGMLEDDRLTPLGVETAHVWGQIKAATAAGFARDGAFTPLAPGADSDAYRAGMTRYQERHHVPAIPTYGGRNA